MIVTSICYNDHVHTIATIDIRAHRYYIRAHRFLYSLQQLMLLDYSIKQALKLANSSHCTNDIA